MPIQNPGGEKNKFVKERERVDGYLDTVGRLEPDIYPIDASAFYASAAISLKRIADALQRTEPVEYVVDRENGERFIIDASRVTPLFKGHRG